MNANASSVKTNVIVFIVKILLVLSFLQFLIDFGIGPMFIMLSFIMFLIALALYYFEEQRKLWAEFLIKCFAGIYLSIIILFMFVFIF
ncbi:hypothetical protein CUU64_16580 [Bacillus sp. V5-8f]|nr:hypothetical protein CUU64_16580 [Bacillus sp. V5-8f]